MKKLYPLLSVLFLISIGNGQKLYEVIETYESGNIKSITFHKKIRDRIEKVKVEEYFENGQKSVEGTFRGGEENGVWTKWFENGQKKWKGKYVDGLLLNYSYQNKDGIVKKPIDLYTKLVEREDVFYTKDTDKPYSGPLLSLYEDGKKKMEGYMIEGIPDGLNTEWYENGQKKVEGTFKDGKLISLKKWNEDGSVKE